MPMYTQNIFDDETIVASGSSTSSAIELAYSVGYFSIQSAVTGDGTAKFEYLLSNDGVTYVEPSSGQDIASSITKTSGPGSDGKDLYYFNPEMARYMKIKVTETGGANSVTINAWIAYM